MDFDKITVLKNERERTFSRTCIDGSTLEVFWKLLQHPENKYCGIFVYFVQVIPEGEDVGYIVHSSLSHVKAMAVYEALPIVLEYPIGNKDHYSPEHYSTIRLTLDYCEIVPEKERSMALLEIFRHGVTSEDVEG